MNGTLKIQSNDQVNKVRETLVKKISGGDLSFVKLINDHTYEFPSGLSARMLNYNTDKKFIHAYRQTEKGKRWFSFVAKIILDYALHSKEQRYDDKNVENAIMTLRAEDANQKGVANIDMAIMIALVLLGLIDIYIATESKTGAVDSDPVNLSMLVSESDEYFNLSKAIKANLFNEDGTVKLDGKASLFPGELIYQIDAIRADIGMPLVSTQAHALWKDTGIKQVKALADSGDVAKLNHLSADEAKRRYDIIYKSEDGELFGIEIKHLGNSSYMGSLKMNAKAESMEDLTKAIEGEIRYAKENIYRRKRN